MGLSDEILDILQNNPRCQYNAYAIYTNLYRSKKGVRDNKKIAKIRTELKRMVDRKQIRRVHRGFYQAKPCPKVIKKLENPDAKLHGIKLEFKVNENNILRIHGITAQNNILSFLRANRFELVKNKSGKSLRRWSRGIFVLDRWTTITLHDGGLVEVFCGCSDYPLSLPDFVRFCDFLGGFFQPIILFKSRDVLVRQIAIARDFWEQELSGVSCITLHKFKNDWARIYQHEDFVRYEHHLTLNITLEDAYNSLQLLTYVPNNNGVNRPDERRDVV